MRIDAKAKYALVSSAFLSTMLLVSEAPEAGAGRRAYRPGRAARFRSCFPRCALQSSSTDAGHRHAIARTRTVHVRSLLLARPSLQWVR
jgi:hypothetical protein